MSGVALPRDRDGTPAHGAAMRPAALQRVFAAAGLADPRIAQVEAPAAGTG